MQHVKICIKIYFVILFICRQSCLFTEYFDKYSFSDFLINEGSSSSEVEEPSASMEAENCAVMNVEDRAQSLPFEDDYIPDFTEGDEVPLGEYPLLPNGFNICSLTL